MSADDRNCCCPVDQTGRVIGRVAHCPAHGQNFYAAAYPHHCIRQTHPAGAQACTAHGPRPAVGRIEFGPVNPVSKEDRERTAKMLFENPGKLASVRSEPPPQPNASKPVWEAVIEDMQARDRFGREKYGTPLQCLNGRDPLVDAYQEALDLVVYLKQAILERGAR